MPPFALPPSTYSSYAAKAVPPRTPRDIFAILKRSPDEIIAYRNKFVALSAPRVEQLKQTYHVTTAPDRIAGVPAIWVRPVGGVSPAKSRKVLLDLPGGGFVAASAASTGMFETIPLVGLMGVEAVSITYRQGPEAHYPAATEDAVNVYREILKTHRPEDVIIYGCSAGGLLTAQTTAALIREKLPLPAAIGILCASADMRLAGDSGAFMFPFQGFTPETLQFSYYKGEDLTNPAISPIFAPEILKHFPPTLLLTSDRTLELSSAFATNNALERLGVISQLNVWDGLAHAFFYDPSLPESREAFEVMARFFGKYLKMSR